MSSAIDVRSYRVALLSALLACGGGSSMQEVDPCFVGEAASDVELEVVVRGADGEFSAAHDMAEVPLIQPPQGGKVIFVGVRAKNLNGCGLTLATALCEPDSGEVVSLERRPVTLEPTGDGWMAPQRPTEASNYSNLPACPRADLARPIEGEVYELRVSVTDVGGRRAERTLRVVPMCGESDRLELCQCECSKDFRLGSSSCGATPVAP